MVDIGVDVKSDWSLNSNGDLNLTSDEDNLRQAIMNRLKCYQPSMSIYYDHYGGYLGEYLGRRRTDETLKFMKIELDTILGQEDRINSFESSLEYTDDGKVHVELLVNVNDELVELNLVLDENGGVSIGD